MNAYAVCSHKCWWLQRQLTMEPHSGLVALGKLLHQEQIERYAEEEGLTFRHEFGQGHEQAS